jgi:hypothetical protein
MTLFAQSGRCRGFKNAALKHVCITGHLCGDRERDHAAPLHRLGHPEIPPRQSLANDPDDVDADVDTENDDDKVRPFMAGDSLLTRSEATEKSVGW